MHVAARRLLLVPPGLSLLFGFGQPVRTIAVTCVLRCREWMKTYKGLDPSNKDSADGGAKINMAKWNIYGMLMPDTIASYKASEGVEYIVTANEGDDKEYEWETSDGTTVWTEMIRGKDMADAGLSVRSSAGVPSGSDQVDQRLQDPDCCDRGRSRHRHYDQPSLPGGYEHDKEIYRCDQ